MTQGIVDFNDFYRRHAPDVMRFALYLTGERSDAEDITAETFVRVWVSTQTIDETSVKAYLFTIARNLFLKGIKRRSRDVELDARMRDPRPDPFAAASSGSDTAAVSERLRRLPERDRAALMLRAVEGMPYEQIARSLNISVSAAKVKVHRARMALADIR